MSPYVRKKGTDHKKSEHKIGKINCLPKTQFLANSIEVVLEMTPAQ